MAAVLPMFVLGGQPGDHEVGCTNRRGGQEMLQVAFTTALASDAPLLAWPN